MAGVPRKSAGATKPAPKKGGGSRLVLALAVLGAAAVVALVWFGRDLARQFAPRPAPVATERRAPKPLPPRSPARGESAARPAEEPAKPAAPDNTLEAAVRSYAAKGGMTVRPADYQVARVELSAGTEQALVLLHAASFCGSCGCTLLVLQHEAAAWSLVSDISCVGRTVRVGDARSHGWRDLVIDAGDSFVLHFDGHSYPPSPQDGERVAAGSVAGTPVALR